MRHPRLTPAPLAAIAHRSRDARTAATTGDLLARVAERAAARGLADLGVRAAFLDHGTPSLPDVLTRLAAERGSAARAPGKPAHAGCVVLPLLLTAAYHATTDIPARIAASANAAAGADAVSGVLGAADEVADVVLTRYRTACRIATARSPAGCGLDPVTGNGPW